MQARRTLPTKPETLADQLSAVRVGRFVGRDDELARWQSFIQPENEWPLWFVHGLPGIGKTSLLRVLEADAIERGLEPVYLDARNVEPDGPAVEYALTRLTGDGGWLQYCYEQRVPLLFIDGFEHWQALACWFRQTFLPAQPTHLKIVLAGRKPPSQEWLTDPGWRPLLTVTELPVLSEQACEAYLWRRRLNPSHRRNLFSFSGGHPLALAIAADAIADGQTVPVTLAEVDDAMLRVLRHSFTREADSMDKRHALDAAAVVRELNEAMLADMLAIDDAGPLFDWLRGLSFVTECQAGIALHELVRQCLMKDLVERAPERYQQLACRAATWIVQRIESAGGLGRDDAAMLGVDMMYALRRAPVVVGTAMPVCDRSLFLDSWRPEDETPARALVARYRGKTALYWFDFWRTRTPESVVVVRDGERQLAGLFVKLAMESLEAEDREVDPLTRKLWQALQTDFGLHPGDHVPFVRLWVTAAGDTNGSSIQSRMLMAIHTANLTAKNLRLTAQVTGNSSHWDTWAVAMGLRPLCPGTVRAGNRRCCIGYHDWTREPPSRHYRRLPGRLFGHTEAPHNANAEAVVDGWSQDYLDEAAFAHAAVVALKKLHHPRKLTENPLLQSAMVSAQVASDAGARRRVEALRASFETAVPVLAEDGARGAHHARVIQTAYFSSCKNYKAAAAALYMGYSTFRRHLHTAHAALMAELWRREKARR